MLKGCKVAYSTLQYSSTPIARLAKIQVGCQFLYSPINIYELNNDVEFVVRKGYYKLLSHESVNMIRRALPRNLNFLQ